MSSVRSRDDFNVWALAEADIARRRLGLTAGAVDRHRLLTLARAERDRGTPIREIDWERLVGQSLHPKGVVTVTLRKLAGKALELVEVLGAPFAAPQLVPLGPVAGRPRSAQPAAEKPEREELSILTLPIDAGHADVSLKVQPLGEDLFRVYIKLTDPATGQLQAGWEVSRRQNSEWHNAPTRASDGSAVFPRIGAGDHEFRCTSSVAEEILLRLAIASAQQSP